MHKLPDVLVRHSRAQSPAISVWKMDYLRTGTPKTYLDCFQAPSRSIEAAGIKAARVLAQAMALAQISSLVLLQGLVMMGVQMRGKGKDSRRILEPELSS